jgi:hypothetical protein
VRKQANAVHVARVVSGEDHEITYPIPDTRTVLKTIAGIPSLWRCCMPLRSLEIILTTKACLCLRCLSSIRIRTSW